MIPHARARRGRRRDHPALFVLAALFAGAAFVNAEPGLGLALLAVALWLLLR